MKDNTKSTPRNDPRITIYSTATCGFCVMLKKYLHEKNIDYVEKRADDNPQYAQELYQKSGQLGVPFSIVTDTHGKEVSILGFDTHKINQALGL